MFWRGGSIILQVFPYKHFEFIMRLADGLITLFLATYFFFIQDIQNAATGTRFELVLLKNVAKKIEIHEHKDLCYWNFVPSVYIFNHLK